MLSYKQWFQALKNLTKSNSPLSLDSRDIFHNYRDAADERARSYQDCGRIYAECGVPKRVNRPHRRRGHLPVTTTTTEEPAASQEEQDQLTSEEMHDEGINEIGNGIDLGEDVQTERSFPAGAFHESDWQPIASEPLLGKLILRRTGAGHWMNLEGGETEQELNEWSYEWACK